ncbi:MAG: thermonuclease family protein [Solirubrobacteraceae bacterium]
MVAAALTGCAGDEPAGTDAGAGLSGEVVRVADGDTVRVRIDGGREERVRYIGIDTPEVTSDECFAAEAAEYNERLVAGRRVRLVLDAEERDRYGRLLAYVYAGDRFVNAELLRNGYAQPLTVPPNVRFEDRFRRLAREARREGKGLWASCSS